MGWKSYILVSVVGILSVISKGEPIVTITDENLLKRLPPPFSLQKDMNNDRCDDSTCNSACNGYCMKESPCINTKSNEEDFSVREEDDETLLKAAENMNASDSKFQKDTEIPYYPHTECFCARNAKQVKYSACYTHNNRPVDPAEGGDYSQVRAYEECQFHCSSRVESYTSRSDDKSIEGVPHELPRIYGALCDTNCNGRLQRFCYCVSFPYQHPSPPGSGWGENGPPSEDGHGWNSPTHGNGWNTPPAENGWNSPPVGWIPPPSAHPPSVPNGWTPATPSVPNGWTPPPPSSHPPAVPNGWTPAPPSNSHPPSIPNGWTPAPPSSSHPASVPNGWTPPPSQPANGWNSVGAGNGWIGLGWTPDPAPHTPHSEKVVVPVPVAEVVPEVQVPDKNEGKTPSRLPVHISSINKYPLGHSSSKSPEKGLNNEQAKHPTVARPAKGKLPKLPNSEES